MLPLNGETAGDGSTALAAGLDLLEAARDGDTVVLGGPSPSYPHVESNASSVLLVLLGFVAAEKYGSIKQ